MSRPVVQGWHRVVPFGHLLGSAVLTSAIARGPWALGSIGLPSAICDLALVLAGAQLLSAVVSLQGSLPPFAVRASAIATGWLLTWATARVAGFDPLAVGVLLSGFVAICVLADTKVLLAGVGGVGLGLLFALAGWPPVPVAGNLSLSVDPTLAGQWLAPRWFKLDHVLAVAATSIGVTGSAIAGASGLWRSRVQHYRALGRVIQARGQLSPHQGALAVTALADPLWAVVGVGVIQWETLRVISVRTPSGRASWRNFAATLRDATVPLSHESNPLVRAARHAQPTDIRSCSDLTEGMWRRFAPTNDRGTTRGMAMAFGSADTRGVVFALSDSRADFAWLDDLARALTLLDVGRADPPSSAPPSAAA